MRTFLSPDCAWQLAEVRKPIVRKNSRVTIMPNFNFRISAPLYSINDLFKRSIFLTPFFEFFQAQSLQRVHVWRAVFFMPSRQAVIFVNEFRQPFGDRKTFVLAVRDRFQESWPDVLPVVLGDPTSLGSEDALQDHRPVTRLQHL